MPLVGVTLAAMALGGRSGWLDMIEEGEGLGGVRAHKAFQTGRRDLRPPAGPCPHPLLEGTDGLVQVSGVGDGDGLADVLSL